MEMIVKGYSSDKDFSGPELYIVTKTRHVKTSWAQTWEFKEYHLITLSAFLSSKPYPLKDHKCLLGQQPRQQPLQQPRQQPRQQPISQAYASWHVKLPSSPKAISAFFHHYA